MFSYSDKRQSKCRKTPRKLVLVVGYQIPVCNAQTKKYKLEQNCDKRWICLLGVECCSKREHNWKVQIGTIDKSLNTFWRLFLYAVPSLPHASVTSWKTSLASLEAIPLKAMNTSGHVIRDNSLRIFGQCRSIWIPDCSADVNAS